jgi:hypothetical protein
MTFNGLANSVDVYRGHGDGTFDAPLRGFGMGTDPGGIDVVDLNHDGRVDLVSISFSFTPNHISVVLNTTGTPVAVRERDLVSGPGLMMDAPSPNPSRGAFTVALALPRRAPATLELFDIAGRRVQARALGALGPGAHRVAFAQDARLAPGVYVIRLSQEGRNVTRRALVVR